VLSLLGFPSNQEEVTTFQGEVALRSVILSMIVWTDQTGIPNEI
jgi:hypothetical protein